LSSPNLSKKESSAKAYSNNLFPPQSSREPFLRVENLSKLFPISKSLFRESRSYIHAVDGVSFTIARGESLALVGESGSGKTTTGKLLVRLMEPTTGNIQMNLSEGGTTEIAHLRGGELKRFRRHVQMIFQDPYESLNPRRTIFDTIAEPLQVQGIGDVAEREYRVIPDAQPGWPFTPTNFYVPFSARAFWRAAPARRYRPSPGCRTYLCSCRRAHLYAWMSPSVPG
jgi:ABC-type glutathione transport system ATPase component